MSLKNLGNVLHRIRVKLYPNYLPGVDGKYIARTDNEASLSIEQVCVAKKERGGFMGSYDTLVEYVKQFLDECAYQLCDGFAVDMGYFSIHPNIGGTFNSEKESHDLEKHPISFRFRPRRALQELIRHIEVEITGIAANAAFIDEFIDREEDVVNSTFVKGNMFCITGSKIKVEGDDPACGVYFVPVDAPDKAVKVERLGENRTTTVTGIIPEVNYKNSRIEIRTQYSGSQSSLLKAPRTIVSDFVLEKA